MTIYTLMVWGRELSSTELDALNTQIAADVAAGQTDGNLEFVPYGDAESAAQRDWTTTEYAQGWLDFCNTFSPPPTTAIIETV